MRLKQVIPKLQVYRVPVVFSRRRLKQAIEGFR